MLNIVQLPKEFNNIPGLMEQKNDMTIYRLAKEVDMSYPAVFKIVKSKHIPEEARYGTLKKIATILGVGVDDLGTEASDEE